MAKQTILQFVASMLLCCVCTLSAENIWFPHHRVSALGDVSGVIDVVKQYGVDNTGVVDVSDTLQKIFNANRRWCTIYLPNGTYLLSKTLNMSPVCTNSDPQSCAIVPILQGQSRKGTILKLKSNTFTNASSPLPVLLSGDGVAQCFNRGVHNLTVFVSTGNPGANGIYWFGNNEALLSDVDVVCEDLGATTTGNIGIDMSGGEEGPCMMRNVFVKGFKYGAKVSALNSVTILKLSLANQTKLGVWNSWNAVFIDSLTSNNTVPAVFNDGNLTMINSFLAGGASDTVAINNAGNSTRTTFLRNIACQGYRHILRSTNNSSGVSSTAMSISEFTSATPIALWTSPMHSMNLPVEYPPEVDWDADSLSWANLQSFISYSPVKSRTPSQAFRAIIDSNTAHTTIIVPAGRGYNLDDTLFLRGNIKRIIGTGGSIGGAPIVITDQCAQPIIKIERMNIGGSIINRSSKTVILESVFGPDGANPVIGEGTGKFYIIDGPLVYESRNHNQKTYLWHYNSESSGDQSGHPDGLTVRDGLVRIFGWKTEVNNTKIVTTGGTCEIVGFLNYYNRTDDKSLYPMIDIANTQFSIGCVNQVGFSPATIYSWLVKETRESEIRTLKNVYDTPLFSAWDSSKVYCPTCPGMGTAAIVNGRNSGAHNRLAISSLKFQNKSIEIFFFVPFAGPAQVIVFDALGNIIASQLNGAYPQKVNYQRVGMKLKPSSPLWVSIRMGKSQITKQLMAEF